MGCAAGAKGEGLGGAGRPALLGKAVLDVSSPGILIIDAAAASFRPATAGISVCDASLSHSTRRMYSPIRACW